MLINKYGKVFVGQRINEKPASFQMPQGGIDEDEAPVEAALRELEEETGIKNVKIIAESNKWLKYEIPDSFSKKKWMREFKGQKQKWFLMEFIGKDHEINIHKYEPEFSNWKWIEPFLLPEIIVEFKRKLYEEVLVQFSKHLN